MGFFSAQNQFLVVSAFYWQEKKHCHRSGIRTPYVRVLPSLTIYLAAIRKIVSPQYKSQESRRIVEQIVSKSNTKNATMVLPAAILLLSSLVLARASTAAQSRPGKIFTSSNATLIHISTYFSFIFEDSSLLFPSHFQSVSCPRARPPTGPWTRWRTASSPWTAGSATKEISPAGSLRCS